MRGGVRSLPSQPQLCVWLRAESGTAVQLLFRGANWSTLADEG
jgi:hypothetical protein